jgi:hypothetical protein
MPSKYIVFEDNYKGLTEMRGLRTEFLETALTSIVEGRCSEKPYYYFIYRLHDEGVPLYGTRFDCYRYVEAVAGSKVNPDTIRNKEGLTYALTHQTSTAWMFTDDIFGDN